MKVTRVIAAALCTAAALAMTPGQAFADDHLGGHVGLPDVYVDETDATEPTDEVTSVCTPRPRRDTTADKAEMSRICVLKYRGYRWATVDWSSSYWRNKWVYGDVTVILRQCRSDNTSCTTVAAAGTKFATYDGYASLATDDKPKVRGYYYKACASLELNTGFRYVYNCTPLTT